MAGRLGLEPKLQFLQGAETISIVKIDLPKARILRTSALVEELCQLSLLLLAKILRAAKVLPASLDIIHVSVFRVGKEIWNEPDKIVSVVTEPQEHYLLRVAYSLLGFGERRRSINPVVIDHS